ncbi:MAG: RDD family protein [Nocardiopsaceae bacterium]|nr:RDD family protein [Nocardiopsaceae bacterium]
MNTPSWYPPPPGPPYADSGPQASALPEGEPAGFAARLAARFVDYLLLGLFAFLFFILATLIASAAGDGLEGDLADGYYDAWVALIIFGWGVLLLFYDWLFHLAWGRTIGKMVLAIKVVRAQDGGRLTQGQALSRAVFFGLPQSLPCIGHTVTLIDCLCALTDSTSTASALHDRASGTRVIRV